MKKAPRLSEAEWQVMKVIWRRASCSAQEVIEALAPNRDWSPATVKTLLNRLHRKGALDFEKTGKAYIYSPAFTEAEFTTQEAESFLHRVFDGALSPMIAHFVQSHRLSRPEIDELERILREERKDK
ncbi:MAG: BlaI/MecI/CopY family transcriptional regulator [Opitutaceae bacterium]